jgi:hypothetical protein
MGWGFSKAEEQPVAGCGKCHSRGSRLPNITGAVPVPVPVPVMRGSREESERVSERGREGQRNPPRLPWMLLCAGGADWPRRPHETPDTAQQRTAPGTQPTLDELRKSVVRIVFIRFTTHSPTHTHWPQGGEERRERGEGRGHRTQDTGHRKHHVPHTTHHAPISHTQVAFHHFNNGAVVRPSGGDEKVLRTVRRMAYRTVR